jgi:endonuclease/exonuclease/phosphatase family metal-dependent hydrolase
MRRFFSLSISIWAAVGPALGQPRFPVAGAPRLESPAAVFERRDAGEAPSNRIRIAFYNIENFTDGEDDGPDRTYERASAQARDAAELIDEIDPHILLLAEIENEQALRLLNERLARPFPFGWITRYAGDGGSTEKLQNAVLSRFAPSETLEMDYGGMSGPGRPPRGALRVLFDLEEGRRLLIYAAHLKSNYGYRPRNMYKRKHALQPIAEDARALMRDATIRWEALLVGDFNVDPELPEFADDWSLSPLRGWTDLWRGAPIEARATVPTRYGDPAREFPPASFDRIFVAGDATNSPWRVGAPGVLQRGVNVRNAFALPGEDAHVSDHYPVWVDLLR